MKAYNGTNIQGQQVHGLQGFLLGHQGATRQERWLRLGVLALRTEKQNCHFRAIDQKPGVAKGFSIPCSVGTGVSFY